MNFLLVSLLSAGILFILASILPGIKIKNFTTAIFVALVIGVLNATIGLLLRLPLNLITLGLVTFVVRIVVSALMIKLADKLFKGLSIKGWPPTLILALCLAVGGYVFQRVLHPH